MKDEDRKKALADLTSRYVNGKVSRRKFLSDCGKLGLGFSAAGLAGMSGLRPWNGLVNTAFAESQMAQETRDWLKEVSKPYRGQTVRMATEATPPSRVISQLVGEEFTKLTGINVEIELLPLEQVLQKLSLDVSGQMGNYDVYYMDQSWMAQFSRDTIDPREKYESNPDLAMPNYNFDDFLTPLVNGISMYKDKMVGVPYDIPIFIMMYRQDIMDELGLKVPETMDEYMSVVKAINEAKAPDTFGTTGQLKSGHYSLECDWTCWLWSHGGSIFGPDGMFTGGDERGMDGLNYMMELTNYMPPGVNGWTWDGQGRSVQQGKAGIYISWGEFFPSFDDPEKSKVVGQMQASTPPKPKALRSPDECGFNEIPHIGHQGGSAAGLSKYSKVPDAAWIFMQWATSSDVQTRASLMGGGSSPVRTSTFEDPRIKEAATVSAGTTRHFPAIRETINNMMGSEPDMEAWPQISNDIIPVELGRLLAGQYDSPKETMDTITSKVNEVTKPYRG
jgi:multiple sugar transport system substrate-binding protein